MTNQEMSSFEEWAQERVKESHRPATYHLTIGPEEARILLRFSHGNRNIDRKHVKGLKEKMLAGRWYDYGDGASVGLNGQLQNAHHRLIALSECPDGTTIPFAITFGVAVEAIGEIDGQVRPRGHRDRRFFENKEEFSIKEVSIIRHYTMLRDGKYEPHNNERFDQCAELCSKALKTIQISSKFAAPFWGALCFAFEEYPEEVAAFAGQVLHPNEHASSQALMLREFLILATKNGMSGSHGTNLIKIRTLQLLRAYVTGKVLQKLPPVCRNGEKVTKDAMDTLNELRAWFGATMTTVVSSEEAAAE